MLHTISKLLQTRREYPICALAGVLPCMYLKHSEPPAIINRNDKKACLLFERMGKEKRRANAEPVICLLFLSVDLLFTTFYDLFSLPVIVRRSLLKANDFRRTRATRGCDKQRLQKPLVIDYKAFCILFIILLQTVTPYNAWQSLIGRARPNHFS